MTYNLCKGFDQNPKVYENQKINTNHAPSRLSEQI